MRRKPSVGLAVALLALAGPLRAQAPSVDPELDNGIRLVDEGDFEAATATLASVSQRLSRQGDRPRELSRARLYLAIAHLQLGREQQARTSFVEALKADPSLKLSRYEFPPKVIQAFEQARREIEALLPAPARPRDPALVPVFLAAVKAGDFPVVRQMLKDDPALANEKDAAFGATPLHWAALRGNEAVVALLIAEGADTSARNRDGETPFQVAQRGKKPEVARLLQPAGSASAGAGIFDAVRRGDAAAVRGLLEANPALVKEADSTFGATPLHWAALKGHAAIAQTLLAHGADANARNKDGETPLRVAERAKKTDVAQVLRAPPPGKPEQPALAGSGELFEAVKRGELAKVQRLVSNYPALMGERDKAFGATALHWAVLMGQRAVVEYLLSQGADRNLKNRDGETPLEVARRARKTDLIPLLE